MAAWRKLDEAWDMIAFGLRLGEKPRTIVTTTPKRRAKLKDILADPQTVISRATTDDNPALPEARRRALYDKYGGTTLGRQELLAELIDDVIGALWNRDIIKYRHAPKIQRASGIELDMVRIVVAIDPAVSNTEDSDETGIVVDGLGPDGNGYTLADLSGRMGPMAWARRAVQAYHDFRADCLVAEANQGGDMVAAVIHQVDPNVPVTLVHASRGKRTRAEPIAARYEQGRWFHVEPFPELEDQQCSFTGEPGMGSPDRMDAHVWGATELIGSDAGGWGVANA
jgi:phage terminase large subunit-like protein